MQDSFKVVVRKKIPYITHFLFYLLMIFVIIFFIADLFFLPVNNASLEMQVAWYILVIPRFINVALAYSLIGFLVILPFYINLRLYKKAILTFLPNAIKISGSSLNYNLSIDNMRRVFCMDERDDDGFPKGRVTFYFEEKRKGKIAEYIIRARLIDYTEIDKVMEHLTRYKNINIKMYDMDISPDITEEV